MNDKIHNPQGVDDRNVIAAEIAKVFGRHQDAVSKHEMMAVIIKMRAMLSELHVNLYCENPKHPWFKKVFEELGALGIYEMENVRRLRMPKWKQYLLTIFKEKT